MTIVVCTLALVAGAQAKSSVTTGAQTKSNVTTGAQVKGVVIDAATGDSIPFASVAYKGHNVSAISDASGRYSIQKREGWTLTFSAVGYTSKTYVVRSNVPPFLTIRLNSESRKLNELVIKSKKSKYSKENNPAVELMRRVIAAKQHSKLENKDFYQYRTYEKMILAYNDISSAKLDSGALSKKEWFKNQVEFNEYTGKNILPFLLNERIFQKYYRKDQNKERIFVEAENTEGINELIETGDIITTAAKDCFTEVDIYDDDIRLLQTRFVSPISKNAIGFYRFYISDTLKVGRDSCIHVTFLPQNQQDFGFRGDLWIIKDSTLQVKKVHLGIPKHSDVNFVTNLAIDQEYLRLPTGEWVLNVNDMQMELAIIGTFGNTLVRRISRHNDFSFEPIEDSIFKGKAKEKYDPYSQMRSKEYWNDNREVSLSKGEAGMSDFIKGMQSTRGFGWLMIGAKALIENFIETTRKGNPSKFDFGPIGSTISSNSIDGLRLRVSGQTTAALNDHLFFKGYVAHGFKKHKFYYSGTVTYSFNKKAYSPDEYPMHNLSISTKYDITAPSDKFLDSDRDNVFAALRWTKVPLQAYTRKYNIDYENERDWGFAIKTGITLEHNTGAGDLFFRRLNSPLAEGDHGSYRTTEAYLQFSYSPGQTYINLKMRRRAINREAPIFKIKHSFGMKGVLGGEYTYNCTEASVFKRFWLSSWGKLDFCLKGGYQWNQVPFPLLIAPAANVSYIRQPQTFGLINNFEFVNDKFVSLNLEWDLNGKILNRIPLLKSLQIRELVGVNVLYGGLSDKNNPLLSSNAGSNILMEFPDGTMPMQSNKPYIEVHAGFHNILKFFIIEYYRRLTYTHTPHATKHGVRFGVRFEF